MSIPVFVLAAFVAQAAPPSAPSSAAPASVDRAEAFYHFSLGLQARFTGDTDEALAEYRRAQKLDPASSAILVETSRLLRELGRVDEATAAAQHAVSLNADDADAHLVLAQLVQVRAAGAEPGLRQAAAEYEAVARLRPTDGQALITLAGIYDLLQDHEKAARTWGSYLAVDPGNFEAYVQRGTHLLLAGKSDEAAAALKAALALRPDDARAYQLLGDVYARAEQLDQAVLHFRKALEIDPHDVRVRLSLGEVLVQAKRPEEALAEAKAVLQQDDSNRYGLDLEGRCLRDLKRYDEADAVADSLLAGDPGDVKAAFLKVTIAESRRDFAKVVALVEALLARPHTANSEAAASDRVFLLHLGFACQQLDQHAAAAAAFARAMAVGGPPDASILDFHAEALYLAKQKKEALAAVRSARERFPDDVDLTGLQATLLREQGDSAGATALVEGMRRRAPKDPKVLGRVADFYRRARQFPESESALRAALREDAQSLSLLFQLGSVLERMKRYDEAEVAFRQALTIEPDSAPILNYLGYMNADRGVKLEEALALIQKAVELDPPSGAYKDSLGWALFRLNRTEAAEDAVRQALAKDGENAVILDHLGDIVDRRGRVAEALQCWRKALKGEDEEGELDRARVETKIRDAEGVLHAQGQDATAPAP